MTVHHTLDGRRFALDVLRNQYPAYARWYKPMPTVQVTVDFARYVAAMAEQWPDDIDRLDFPSMADARWPFPDTGVLLVFDEPISLEFLVVSEGKGHRYRRLAVPRHDEQPVVSVAMLPPSIPKPQAVTPEGMRIVGAEADRMRAAMSPAIYVHPDTMVTDSWVAWGSTRYRHEGQDRIGHVGRFERALIEAVGHRMTSLTPPVGLPRHERRAIERTAVPYRILDLRTKERATPVDGDHRSVAWSKRWGVRGHWRNQPYGPRHDPSYRLTWIDPYIKGPDDKPLDLRPDIFRLDQP